MGVCVSAEARAANSANKKIDENLWKDREAEQRSVKMLLLGPGECGKSTVLKQMRIIHMNGFDKKAKEEYVPLIYMNINTSMYALLEARKKLNIEFKDFQLDAESMLIYQIIEGEKDRQPLTPELIKLHKRLWNDEAIQECYIRRSEFQLNDSAKFFLDNLERVTKPDFEPTTQDILFTRVATMGIVEVLFHFKGLLFRVFDVGGQKSERRKWIHCFDSVNAIIFLIALSEYDTVLREDHTVNRMIDALTLFGDTCNSEFFLDTDIILFMNKRDLFAEKLKQSSIKTAFPEYTGTSDYTECVKYMKSKFLDLNNNKQKVITCHETCATDTNQVQIVIDQAIGIIIDKNLESQGMV